MSADWVHIQERCKRIGLLTLEKRSGIARSHLYKLLSGEVSDPSVRTLCRLASALDIPVIHILRHYINLHQKSRHVEQPSLLVKGSIDPSDAVVFRGDVTTPDHSIVRPGERFTKTWQVRNAGDVLWKSRSLVRVDEDYVVARRVGAQLVPVIEERLFSPTNFVAIHETAAGQSCVMSVDFIAPQTTCSVASVWQMQDHEGQASFPHQFLLRIIATVAWV